MRRFALLVVILLVLSGAVGAGTGAARASTASFSPLPCSARSGHKIVAHGPGGGADIQLETQVSLVFWGSYWRSSTGRRARAHVVAMFQGIGTSSWARTITQYCEWFQSETGWFSEPPFMVSNPKAPADEVYRVYTDTGKPPATPKDGAIITELRKHDGDNFLGGPHIYPIGLPIPAIVLPPGHEAYADRHDGFCSYHSWMTYSSGGDKYIQPYMVIDYGALTGPGSILGCRDAVDSLSALGALTVVAGHEWAETITDPFDSGWYGKNTTAEVADLCMPDNLALFVARHNKPVEVKLATGRFLMQQLWSNARKACVKGS
jgi:hypothetical protein